MKTIKKIALFYIDGFRKMPKWGKTIWLIILLKLFIMFVIMKLFFFPNFMKQNFETDEERVSYILEQLT
jgi:uncharacterized protein YpmB